MSCYCCGEIQWDTLVQNTLDWTLYLEYYAEGNPSNVLEDLGSAVFSAVVHHPEDEEAVYARAIGDAFEGEVGKVAVLEVGETKSRILVTFPAAATTEKEWDYAAWSIHDITDPDNPIKKLTGTLRLKPSATPTVPPEEEP